MGINEKWMRIAPSATRAYHQLKREKKKKNSLLLMLSLPEFPYLTNTITELSPEVQEELRYAMT